MSVLRVQELTPSVYTEDSRDFQLLGRLYDSVFNGMKFDTDSIISLIDTKECRTSVLQLLQTKLGFFTERKIDDEKLRSILECFPIIVRNKGSLKAIKETLYLFLRMYSVASDMDIYYLKTPTSPPFSEDGPCVLSNGKLPDNNSLIIRIHSFHTKPDTSVLEELFTYILPAGINYYIEFDKGTSLPDIVLKSEDSAELLFVSDNISANLRVHDQSESYKLGSANTSSIISNTSYVSNRFIGYYDSEQDADDYLQTLSTQLYSTAIINYTSEDGTSIESRPMICVAYSNNTPTWYRINFLGNISTEEVSTEGGIISALEEKGITVNNGDLILYNDVYLLRVENNWQECNYARYILNTYSITE